MYIYHFTTTEIHLDGKANQSLTDINFTFNWTFCNVYTKVCQKRYFNVINSS